MIMLLADGQAAADAYVAAPGTSEHHTGLAGRPFVNVKGRRTRDASKSPAV